MKEKITILILALYSFPSFALEIGCDTSNIKKEICTETNPLSKENSFMLTNIDNLEKTKVEQNSTNLTTINISKNLKSIKIHYQEKPFYIERTQTIKGKSCPPYCIQPMHIKNIKTIGELETLDFIQKLQKNKNKLLVDARDIIEYKESTIPGSINIPSKLIDSKNKYSTTILKLLGGKKVQNKWFFKTTHDLLIFDNGIWDNHASNIINRLIKLGYPQNKILYYRGGVQSWKEAGLTLF